MWAYVGYVLKFQDSNYNDKRDILSFRNPVNKFYEIDNEIQVSSNKKKDQSSKDNIIIKINMWLEYTCVSTSNNKLENFVE